MIKLLRKDDIIRFNNEYLTELINQEIESKSIEIDKEYIENIVMTLNRINKKRLMKHKFLTKFLSLIGLKVTSRKDLVYRNGTENMVVGERKGLIAVASGIQAKGDY